MSKTRLYLLFCYLFIFIYLIYESITYKYPKIVKDEFMMKKPLWSKGPIRSNYSMQNRINFIIYKIG